jgi:hypothetical protein
MTTIEIYESRTGEPGTTVSVSFHLVPQWLLAANKQVVAGTTQAPAMPHPVRARLIHELAERSIQADNGLDPDVLNRIDREGWGLSDA